MAPLNEKPPTMCSQAQKSHGIGRGDVSRDMATDSLADLLLQLISFQFERLC